MFCVAIPAVPATAQAPWETDYATPDQAATEILNQIYQDSDGNYQPWQWESGGWIVQNRNGYRPTPPHRGERPGSVELPNLPGFNSENHTMNGDPVVGAYHNHPRRADDPDRSESFSDFGTHGDIPFFQKYGLEGFLITPSGTILKWDRANGVRTLQTPEEAPTDVNRPPGGESASYVEYDPETGEFRDPVSGERRTDWACGSGGCSVSSYGDPHVSTCDGLRYEFQTVGEYYGLISHDKTFAIQVRQEPVEALRASKNTAVAALVHGTRAAVYANDGELLLRVNGTAVESGTEESLPEGGSLAHQGDRVILTWEDGSMLTVNTGVGLIDLGVSIAPALTGWVRGLYGNCDGLPENDLMTPDGRVITLPPEDGEDYGELIYRTFGDSWRITAERSLFDYEQGRSSEQYQDLDYPDIVVTVDDIEEQAREEARRICLRSGAAVQPFLDACVFDVGLTGEATFSESSARAAEAGGYKVHSTNVAGDEIVLIEQFEGASGDQFYFRTAGIMGSLDLSSWELVGPSGEFVFRNCIRCNQPGAVILGEDGEFTSRIIAEAGESGTLVTTRNRIPPPSVFVISLPARIRPGVPVAGAGRIEIPGALDQYLFEAGADSALALLLEARAGQLYFGKWVLQAPSGEILMDRILPGGGPPAEKVELTESGRYRLTVTGGDSWPAGDDYGYGEYTLSIDAVPSE